jgi:hypothetical protein
VLQTTLATDSTISYVAAQSLAVGSGAAFVAGLPSRVFRTNSLGQAVHVTRDSIVGAIVRPGRPAVLVPSPLPDRIPAWFRPAAVGPDRWVVVFAEVAAREGPDRLRVLALWMGVLGADGWESVHLIDRPPAGVHAFGSSRLVLRNDTLTWAVPNPRAWPEEVIVYTGVEDQWSAATLQVPGAVDVEAASTRDDVYLAVSTVDMNGVAELLILERSQGWDEVARFTDTSRLYDAHIVPTADSIKAVWTPDMMWQGLQDVRTGSVALEQRGAGRELWSRARIWTPVVGGELVAVMDTSYVLSLLSLQGARTVLTLPNALEGQLMLAGSDSAGSHWLVSGPESALGGDVFTTTFVFIGQPCPVE